MAVRNESGRSKAGPADDPLTALWQSALRGECDGDTARETAIREYAFAVPGDAALQAIKDSSPRGVVEVGAGTGYWARVLSFRGVDVAAFDPEPPPSNGNTWFAGVEPWHAVLAGDHCAAGAFPERSLLIVWPTKNETWPVEALDAYYTAGGSTVLYVGEEPGGHTGDAAFHARLGETQTCLACVHGLATEPCTCSYSPQWVRSRLVDIPRWPGFHDRLAIYERRTLPDTRRSRWIRRAGP